MEKFITEIVKIWNETHDVKTFRMKNPTGISFIPGQYCLVSLPAHKKFSQTTRPFTFSNSPTVRDFLELTIKEMGEFTQTLFQSNPGDRLQIQGPLGESLIFDEKSGQDIVFLAGGSGITPFISMIRYWAVRNLENKLILFYGNRTEEDIIYRMELDHLSKTYSHFQVIHILDRPSSQWKGEIGRISRQVIEKYIDSLDGKLWYLCGPPPMMAAMKKILADWKIPEQQWRAETWELPAKHSE